MHVSSFEDLELARDVNVKVLIGSNAKVGRGRSTRSRVGLACRRQRIS